MIRKSIMLIMLMVFLAGCEKKDFAIELEEISDEGQAIFGLKNNTEKDIASFTIEFTYLSEDEQVLLKDTVNHYSNDSVLKNGKFGESAFLKAGNKTFLSEVVPDGTTSASGKVLNYKIWK